MAKRAANEVCKGDSSGTEGATLKEPLAPQESSDSETPELAGIAWMALMYRCSEIVAL